MRNQYCNSNLMTASRSKKLKFCGNYTPNYLKKFRYISPWDANNNKANHSAFKKRRIQDMKATGIVRRIDDCGIITQRGLCRINTGVLLILSKN